MPRWIRDFSSPSCGGGNSMGLAKRRRAAAISSLTTSRPWLMASTTKVRPLPAGSRWMKRERRSSMGHSAWKNGPYARKRPNLIQMPSGDHAEQHRDRQQGVDAAEHGGGLGGSGFVGGSNVGIFAADIERLLLVGPDQEPDIE